VLINSINSRTDRRPIFTSSQAAVYLGVSLDTIKRWTDAGHLGCYRTPGGQRRFSRDQLERFLATLHRNGAAERSALDGPKRAHRRRSIVA
jgi:excisionase family DNA binding protein